MTDGRGRQPRDRRFALPSVGGGVLSGQSWDHQSGIKAWQRGERRAGRDRIVEHESRLDLTVSGIHAFSC